MIKDIFGKNKKITLIRKLLEQRMRRSGYDDPEHGLAIKKLSNFELMATPEALLVTTLETIIQSQKNGALLANILLNIEDHRKELGHSPSEFNDILKIAKSSNPGECVNLYCSYRISLEHPSLLNTSEVNEIFEEAVYGVKFNTFIESEWQKSHAKNYFLYSIGSCIFGTLIGWLYWLYEAIELKGTTDHDYNLSVAFLGGVIWFMFCRWRHESIKKRIYKDAQNKFPNI